MSDGQTYRIFPAVRCWIKQLLEAKYFDDEKVHYTIFGKVKRVRLIATIVEKREIINTQGEDSSEIIDDDESSNMRIEFDLDDGSGLIRATIWRANPENYNDLVSGDIVDVTGILRNWKGFVSLSPDFIKKVDDPNFKLLLDAEIIKRIKFGDTYEIPEYESEQIDEIPDEFDIESMFDEEEPYEEEDENKLRIIEIIREKSSDGEGVSFNDLKSIIDISEKDLRTYLQELEIESKIYESETNVYQIL